MADKSFKLRIKQTKKFDKVNPNDKLFIDLSPLKDKNNYPNVVNYAANITSLSAKVKLYTLAETEDDKKFYFERAKSLLFELQHKFNNKFFPNVFCVETLTDEEIKEIIFRLEKAIVL